MPSFMDIHLAGQNFRLLADRGVYWPEQQALFVADTHFGKEATFRAHGVPVPVGSTGGTLARVTKMLCETGAKRLCILGDMFHARSSLSPDVRASVRNCMAQYHGIEWMLVRGNHDAHVGQLPSDWPIAIVEPGLTIGRVAFGHLPQGVPEGADVYLCGHLHPAVRVVSRRESLGKIPCFWHSRGCVVLPAIGEFTGTEVVQCAAEDDVWIVADNQIHKYEPHYT